MSTTAARARQADRLTARLDVLREMTDDAADRLPTSVGATRTSGARVSSCERSGAFFASTPFGVAALPLGDVPSSKSIESAAAKITARCSSVKDSLE